MSERRVFRLVHRIARANAVEHVARVPEGYIVTVAPPTRSSEQNAKMWAALGDIAAQVEWHGQYLTKEEWKDVCTAALKRQKVVPGIEGGFVVLGSSTSRMSKEEMSDLIEFAQAFGAERGVQFGDAAYVGQVCEPIVRQHEQRTE